MTMPLTCQKLSHAQLIRLRIFMIHVEKLIGLKPVNFSEEELHRIPEVYPGITTLIGTDPTFAAEKFVRKHASYAKAIILNARNSSHLVH